MTTRAVLFDFDGVIADTANVHVAAWQRTFGAMGWVEADEVCARAAEVDDRAFVAEVFARHKLEGGDVEGWVARKQALTLRILGDAPRIVPGVAGLVEALSGRVRLGIVTTTWRANVEAVLVASGLAGAFEFVIAKEDVSRPKPDPEGYALALSRLGLDGTEVVAIEDSATGLAAARGAGLRTLAVGLGQGERSGDSVTVANLTDLSAVLAGLGLAVGPA